MTSRAEELRRELEAERMRETSELLRSDPTQPRSAIPQSGPRIDVVKRGGGWITPKPLSSPDWCPKEGSMWNTAKKE
jgi:hypothetical protein